MTDKLIDYIRDWQTKLSPKPCNEQEFIDLFLSYIASSDLEFSFDGLGSYFGKQISICRYYYGYDVLSFEIAYDNDHIRIYDGNHNSFWVPEYVDIMSDHPMFNQVKTSVFQLIKNKVGLI